jgi:alkyldihydroxyacetonephosphate synthase
MENRAAQRRLKITSAHVKPENCSAESNKDGLSSEECAARPISTFKWNGYGYEDTSFSINDDGVVTFRGPRYELHGKTLPHFIPWAVTVGFKQEDKSPAQRFMKIHDSHLNQAFLEAIKGKYTKISFDDQERIFHSHGHTLDEVYKLRNATFDRVPDVVIYPATHEQVEYIVKAANEQNVVIIPFGGGTNVTWAVLCPPEEKRMIVSLDMREMNAIKWIDLENMTVCVEAGATGEDLEERLQAKGLCIGHEPDSYEFSTLGGWIATRASGMKKNVYGNIEDLLISCKIVTSIGTIERKYQAPRISSGPDVNEMILGSEGNFGVITEAVLKVRYLPESKVYGAIVFPSFSAGFNTLRELALMRCYPASIRLVDNEQFRLGHALKVQDSGVWTKILDAAKKFYVTKLKGFDEYELCVATLLFEGSKADVELQEKTVYAVAKKYNGLKSSPADGRRGYVMTFMVAYIRDIVMDYYFVAESFETSIPYSKALECCTAVKSKIKALAKAWNLQHEPFVSCRITQLYDTGCAIYFYYGFKYKGIADPLKAFSDMENQAREVILANGGSISHHHGIGKLRAHFVPQVIDSAHFGLLKGMKRSVDPKNIFAAGNMGL